MKKLIFIISMFVMWMSFCTDSLLVAIIGIAQFAIIGILTDSFGYDLFENEK